MGLLHPNNIVVLVCQVYLPGDPLAEDEKLTYDSSAYVLYHEVSSLFLQGALSCPQGRESIPCPLF